MDYGHLSNDLFVEELERIRAFPEMLRANLKGYLVRPRNGKYKLGISKKWLENGTC